SQGFTIKVFTAIQTAAPSLGMEVIPVNMRDVSEIEQSVVNFARSPNGGLIPSPSAAVVQHRDLIVTLAARHKLPAIYWERFFVTAGGLMSYGPDLTEAFPRDAKRKMPNGFDFDSLSLSTKGALLVASTHSRLLSPR